MPATTYEHDAPSIVHVFELPGRGWFDDVVDAEPDKCHQGDKEVLGEYEQRNPHSYNLIDDDDRRVFTVPFLHFRGNKRADEEHTTREAALRVSVFSMPGMA